MKLLRVLEERQFERIGSSTPTKVDVRLLAATNRNLLEKVSRGELREDLLGIDRVTLYRKIKKNNITEDFTRN